MNDDNLIRMANQIGVFFESMPDRAKAMQDLAMHLKKFWDPRMRKAFLDLMDAPDHHFISEIVRTAVLRHRSLLV